MSFDPFSCELLGRLDNATVVDGVLTASAPDARFPIWLPVWGEADEFWGIEVVGVGLHLVATVTGTGDAMTWTNGIIGTAIPKTRILEALRALPPETTEGWTAEGSWLSVSIGMVVNLFDIFVQEDIDLDDDGEPDGASIGIKFETMSGKTVGMVKEESVLSPFFPPSSN